MKSKILLASVALSLGLASSASASLILYESFNYPVGETLVGKSGGVGFSRAWEGTADAGVAMSVHEGLSYGDLITAGGSTGDISTATAHSMERGIAGADELVAAGNTQWFSYLLNVPSTVTTGSGYVTFFGSGTYAGIGTRAMISSGNLVIGAELNGTVLGTVPFSADVTHLVLGQISWNTDTNATIQVWLDPELDGLTEVTLGTPDINRTGTISVGDWLWTRGNNGMQFILDEVRLGTDLASVTPIPEPSTYAMLFGALSLGLVVLRRRTRKA